MAPIYLSLDWSGNLVTFLHDTFIYRVTKTWNQAQCYKQYWLLERFGHRSRFAITREHALMVVHSSLGLTHGLKASWFLFLLILSSDQLPGVRLHIWKAFWWGREPWQFPPWLLNCKNRQHYSSISLSLNSSAGSTFPFINSKINRLLENKCIRRQQR